MARDYARKRKFLEAVNGASGADSYWATTIDHVTPAEDRPSYWYRDIQLKLADCDRNIKLEFGYEDAAGLRARKRKLARLQEALDMVREALYEDNETGGRK